MDRDERPFRASCRRTRSVLPTQLVAIVRRRDRKRLKVFGVLELEVFGRLMVSDVSRFVCIGGFLK